MITVIIAGGSGTRLWPLSTPKYPKHLLKLYGNERSLLQATYDRAQLISQAIYIVTDHSHESHVRDQLHYLPKDHFIIEPDRRGTASCIVTALAQIAKRHPADEPIAFLHADHYIRDTKGFVHSFAIAERVSKVAKKIVLVGVEPDHPATGFGYIQKDGMYEQEAFVFQVQSFKEKPPFNQAKKYTSSGNYLWNCGYFVGSLRTFQSAMKQYAPTLLSQFDQLANAKDAATYNQLYSSFKSEAIDYALIEKVKDLLVVPATFDWMDLGSFTDLHKAVESDELGNHVYGNIELSGVENSFIQNHESKPVAIIGLDNIAVINTPEGVLITRKDLAQAVGEIGKRINAKQQ
jgi:mannose-1-phosphate guanylyltransferase